MSADKYDLEERLLEYAARIIRLTEHMSRSPAGLHVAQQVLRSGPSALPKHGEAQAAKPNRDFIITAQKTQMTFHSMQRSEFEVQRSMFPSA